MKNKKYLLKEIAWLLTWLSENDEINFKLSLKCFAENVQEGVYEQ